MSFRMGLSRQEFWEMTWREYWIGVQAHEEELEDQYHRVCIQVAAIYNTVPRRKGAPPYKPQDIMNLKRYGNVEDAPPPVPGKRMTLKEVKAENKRLKQKRKEDAND